MTAPSDDRTDGPHGVRVRLTVAASATVIHPDGTTDADVPGSRP